MFQEFEALDTRTFTDQICDAHQNVGEAKKKTFIRPLKNN